MQPSAVALPFATAEVARVASTLERGRKSLAENPASVRRTPTFVRADQEVAVRFGAVYHQYGMSFLGLVPPFMPLQEALTQRLVEHPMSMRRSRVLGEPQPPNRLRDSEPKTGVCVAHHRRLLQHQRIAGKVVLQ